MTSLTINQNSNDSIIRRNTIISLLERKTHIKNELERINLSIYTNEETLKNKGGMKKFFIKAILTNDDTIQDFIYAVNEDRAEEKFFEELNSETQDFISCWDVKEVKEI